jgi:hypothetical protein
MDVVFGTLATAIGSLGLFGFLALAVWLEYRKKRDERQTAHLERMKALELGQPLPDAEIARATAEVTRARAAGLIGALVPTIVAVAAGVASGFILSQRDPEFWAGMHPKAHLLLVVWLPSAVVILVTGIVALAVLRRRPPAPADARPAHPIEHRSEAFTERSPGWEK